MYRALLFVQWKQQRFELLAFATIAAAASPLALLSVRAQTTDGYSPWSLLSISPVIGAIGAALAVIVGTVLAVRPYASDAATRHTYALALPMRRSEYSLLRAAAGLTLITLPTAGFLIGAMVAARAITMPPMMHAYPIGLSVRFLFAAITAFAASFALQYSLGQRATSRLVLIVVVIAVIELVAQFTTGASAIGPALRVLGRGVSPLRLFTLDWTLFDV
jgi:hypothetical protein